jgi:hypothetical protein
MALITIRRSAPHPRPQTADLALLCLADALGSCAGAWRAGVWTRDVARQLGGPEEVVVLRTTGVARTYRALGPLVLGCAGALRRCLEHWGAHARARHQARAIGSSQEWWDAAIAAAIERHVLDDARLVAKIDAALYASPDAFYNNGRCDRAVRLPAALLPLDGNHRCDAMRVARQPTIGRRLSMADRRNGDCWRRPAASCHRGLAKVVCPAPHVPCSQGSVSRNILTAPVHPAAPHVKELVNPTKTKILIRRESARWH